MTPESQTEYITYLAVLIGAQDSQSEYTTYLASVIGSGLGI